MCLLFSNFFFILVVNVYLAYFGVSSFYQPCLLVLKSKFNNSKIITSNSITVRRYYSTYKKKAGLKDILEKKSYRKTLSSPESRPYVNLYKGRGVPKNEPTWVKDNGKERSPFGASWAKDKKDRLPFPTKYPCNYRNIMDPYNNRESIKEVCKGNRVVYIWTYQKISCLCMPSSLYIKNEISPFSRGGTRRLRR